MNRIPSELNNALIGLEIDFLTATYTIASSWDYGEDWMEVLEQWIALKTIRK